MGPCAKRTVTCVLVTASGDRFVGRNDCRNPQAQCPRLPGDDYEKCSTICAQDGHAEIQALRQAVGKTDGAVAYIENHDYACKTCQQTLYRAGVRHFVLGAAPA